MSSALTVVRSPGGEHPGQAGWLDHPLAATSLSVLAVCAGYYLAGILSLISRFPVSGITTIWLATSLLLAALLLVPRRSWWLYCLALLPVHIHLVRTFQGAVPLPVMLIQWGGNCALAVLAAAALRPLLGVPPRLVGLRNMALFILVACFATPWLVSAVVVLLFQQLGWTPDFWFPWCVRSLSNGVAALIMVPLILWVMTEGPRAARHAPLRRHIEFAVLAIALLGVGLAVFGGSSPRPGGSPAMLYAPLPLLLWATVRFGIGGLCASLAAVAIASLSNAIAGRGPFIHESLSENVLGLQLFLFAVATPLVLLSAVMQDRKLIETRLQELGGRLIDAQEQERARIARELHDDLGQRMALLQVGVEQFAQHVGDLSSKALQQLGAIREAATGMSSSIHDFSHQLHPLMLEAVGLEPALRSLCREFGEQHGVRVSFVDQDVPERLAGAARVCLFRIAQEALRNVVTHSGVTEAAMELSGHDSGVELSITDRGRGFSPAAADGKAGLGLVSMRERLRLLGGRLDIRSAPGEGTRIVARLGALAPFVGSVAGATPLQDADLAGNWTDNGQPVRGDPS